MDCRQVCLEQGEDQTGTRTCQVAQKTVDFVDDLCLGAAEALSATTAKAPVEEKKEEKKEVKAVVNSGPTVITPKKQVTVEPAQAAEKASEGIVKDAQVIEVPQVKKPAALVPAQKSQQQEYKTIAPEQLSADAIQTGAGKLVIVIGQEPFNMTMMTANSGGSLGKVNGKPVVFSILSPDQPYEQMEKQKAIPSVSILRDRQSLRSFWNVRSCLHRQRWKVCHARM